MSIKIDPIFTILTIIFTALKLCNIINWSWLWVLSPLWISWLIVFLMVVIILLIHIVID